MDNKTKGGKKVIKEAGDLLQLAPLPLQPTSITFESSAALRVHLKGANECNYSAALSAFKCLLGDDGREGGFSSSERYAKYLPSCAHLFFFVFFPARAANFRSTCRLFTLQNASAA